jgi:hypothetical protein
MAGYCGLIVINRGQSPHDRDVEHDLLCQVSGYYAESTWSSGMDKKSSDRIARPMCRPEADEQSPANLPAQSRWHYFCYISWIDQVLN